MASVALTLWQQEALREEIYSRYSLAQREYILRMLQDEKLAAVAAGAKKQRRASFRADSKDADEGDDADMGGAASVAAAVARAKAESPWAADAKDDDDDDGYAGFSLARHGSTSSGGGGGGGGGDDAAAAQVMFVLVDDTSAAEFTVAASLTDTLREVVAAVKPSNGVGSAWFVRDTAGRPLNLNEQLGELGIDNDVVLHMWQPQSRRSLAAAPQPQQPSASASSSGEYAQAFVMALNGPGLRL